MKLPEYIRTIISLEPTTISNQGKLVLVYLITHADEAGVYTVNKENYLQSFGMRYKKEWIISQLGFWIKYIDENKILIPGYLRYRYGDQLRSIENSKYNVLNKLRNAIKQNRLKLDSLKLELTPLLYVGLYVGI